jgi:hypothetical protein
MNQPVFPLDPDDAILPDSLGFARLIRSALRSFAPSGKHFLMPAAELEGLTFAQAGAEGLVLELNSFFSFFFSAPWLKAPTPLTHAKDYAERLRGAFARTKTVSFTSSDALGRARVSQHTSKMLREEASSLAFLYSGVKRVLSAVPAAHSFGFAFSLLAPTLLKTPVLEISASPDLSGLSLQKGDLIILFPQLLQKLAVDPPPDVTLLCSASPPLDSRLFRAAKSMGFRALIEVYGTSVTGALGFRRGEGPYELFAHFSREGERSLSRAGTGETFTSKRIVWRRGRTFGHWSQE